MTYMDSGGLRLFYSGSGTGPPTQFRKQMLVVA
jgi:hypothetical protein